jgi:hypothetical protein
MQNLKWLGLVLLLVAPIGARPAAAAPSMGLDMSEAASPLVEVAVHCGPHAHYIRGHRARNGQWIKGRCVRYRRR